MLYKKRFKSKIDFINFMWNPKELVIGITAIERRIDLAPSLGLEWLGKEEITGNQNDDGHWAGKEYYNWGSELPKKFPCVMVLVVLVTNYDNCYSVQYVYESDFKFK